MQFKEFKRPHLSLKDIGLSIEQRCPRIRLSPILKTSPLLASVILVMAMTPAIARADGGGFSIQEPNQPNCSDDLTYWDPGVESLVRKHAGVPDLNMPGTCVYAYDLVGPFDLLTPEENAYLTRVTNELAAAPLERFETNDADTALLAAYYRDYVAPKMPEDKNSLSYFTQTIPNMSAEDRRKFIKKTPLCGYGSYPSDGCSEILIGLGPDPVTWENATVKVWIYPQGTPLSAQIQRQADIAWGYSQDGKYLGPLHRNSSFTGRASDEPNFGGHVTVY